MTGQMEERIQSGIRKMLRSQVMQAICIVQSVILGCCAYELVMDLTIPGALGTMMELLICLFSWMIYLGKGIVWIRNLKVIIRIRQVCLWIVVARLGYVLVMTLLRALKESMTETLVAVVYVIAVAFLVLYALFEGALARQLRNMELRLTEINDVNLAYSGKRLVILSWIMGILALVIVVAGYMLQLLGGINGWLTALTCSCQGTIYLMIALLAQMYQRLRDEALRETEQTEESEKEVTA